MGFGACFYTMLIGTLSAFLAAMDTRGHELSERLKAIDAFSKQARIDIGLTERLRSSVEYKVKNDFFSSFEPGNFLEGTSETLLYEVPFPVCESVVGNDDEARDAEIDNAVRGDGTEPHRESGGLPATAED